MLPMPCQTKLEHLFGNNHSENVPLLMGNVYLVLEAVKEHRTKMGPQGGASWGRWCH